MLDVQPIKRVTRESWEEDKEEIACICRRASAVSIDLEMSGVGDGEMRYLHGAGERYGEARQWAERYCVVQMGLCFVTVNETASNPNPALAGWTLHTYELHLRPDEGADICFSVDSLLFLRGAHFDFSGWAANALPYSEVRETVRTAFTLLPVIGFSIVGDLLYAVRSLFGKLPEHVDDFVAFVKKECRPRLVADCRLLHHMSHAPSLKVLHKDLCAKVKAEAEETPWHTAGADALATMEVLLMTLRLAGVGEHAKKKGIEAVLRSQFRNVVDRVPFHWSFDALALNLGVEEQYCPKRASFFKGDVVLHPACFEDASALKRHFRALRLRCLADATYLLRFDKAETGDMFFAHSAFRDFKEEERGGEGGKGKGKGKGRHGATLQRMSDKKVVVGSTLFPLLSDPDAVPKEMSVYTVEEFLRWKEAGASGGRGGSDERPRKRARHG